MFNAKDFFKDEELAYVLNTPGSLWTTDGNPAADETLGSELERFYEKHKEQIIGAESLFENYTNQDGTNRVRLETVQVWTENYLLVILDSIFNDKYLAVFKRHPPKK